MNKSLEFEKEGWSFQANEKVLFKKTVWNGLEGSIISVDETLHYINNKHTKHSLLLIASAYDSEGKLLNKQIAVYAKN